MIKKSKKESQSDATDRVMNSVLKKIGIEIHEDIAFLEPAYYLSTSSIGINNILSSAGGLPPGMVEIYGPEGAGKTTLALGILGEAQQIGLTGYFIDVEHKLHASTVKTIHGLNPEKIKWPEVEHGGDVIKVLDALLPSIKNAVFIVDSIPAMLSEAQFREASDKDDVGTLARLFGKLLPKARVWTRRNSIILIWLNQEREVISTMGYGPRTRTPGGRAIKHYCDVRLSLKVIERIKKGDDVIGQRLKVTTEKNSMARPYQSVKVALMYGYGIDAVHEIYELGLQFGLIEKRGPWFTYGEHRTQGSEKLIGLLRSNEALLAQLKSEVRENI